MAAEKFRAAEDAFFKLRGQFDLGRITPEQFDEQLRELAVQDAQGRYWMPGAESGEWYFYDGSEWTKGDPVTDTASGVVAAPSIPAAETSAVLPTFEPGRAAAAAPVVPASEDRRPLFPVVVGAAILLCLFGAILLFLNRDRLNVVQPPSAQITPDGAPTLTGLLPTTTSEPDFFYTDTPIAALSTPRPAISTPQPTPPLVTVVATQQAPSTIPTITPFVISTSVPQPPTPSTLPPPPSTLPTGRLRVGNGPDARADYLPLSQLVLDGSLTEWNGEQVPLTVPHFGADNWLGPSDLSGSAQLGWNENFLLVAVQVVDDTHVQTQRSWEMFRGDSVELWIDADLEGDFEIAAGNGDDYQFGLSPGDMSALAPEGVVYIPFRDAAVNQQILVAAQPTSTGYTLEAAIPWSILRVQPGPGRVIGYSLDLSDNDVPNTAQQQTQVNHNPNFQFRIPATFGNLFLE